MIRNAKRRAAFTAIAGASVLALGLTACSGGGGDSNGGDGGADATPLRIQAGGKTPLEANFNPFSPNVLSGTSGMIFESLFVFNAVKAEDPIPSIGESYEFNEDGTVLTITIKPDLKWNDGEPLTSSDVAYTFQHPGNDPEGQGLVSAETPDDTTVVLTYDAPQFTSEWQRLGNTAILPEHVWSEVDDFLTFTNAEDPVGSGPYVIDDFSSETYTLVVNENYRDADELKIPKIQYLAIDSNQAMQDLLTAGQIDWVSMFVPNPESVTGSGDIAMVNTPQNPTALYTCSNADLGCTGPQTDVAVRQALNLALNRDEIDEKAFVGLTGDISPTFALMPRDEKWVGDPANKLSPREADAEAAKAILEEAGYTLGSDGYFTKDGAVLEMTMQSIEGWTDYNDAAKLIVEQAAAAGIKLNNSTIQQQEFFDQRQSGQYQLLVGGITGTSVADPYQMYRDWFGGIDNGSTAPVGEVLPAGRWNVSRYNNPIVDEQLAIAAGTNDEATKKEAYATIQQEIVRDLPYIPIVVNATQTFFNVTRYSGWPVEEDLYMYPPSWSAFTAAYVLQQLEPNN